MHTLQETLSADESFRREFLSAPTHQAAAELLEERGWSVTSDEVRALREARSPGIDELSDSELETVSGGTGTFTSVSNVLKTRHDTAKNSISNVR